MVHQIIDVSTNGHMNIRRNNDIEERFIDDFLDFKKFAILEFHNINQKIANLIMKHQYSQGNNLNEQQEWKEANSSTTMV